MEGASSQALHSDPLKATWMTTGPPESRAGQSHRPGWRSCLQQGVGAEPRDDTVQSPVKSHDSPVWWARSVNAADSAPWSTEQVTQREGS